MSLSIKTAYQKLIDTYPLGDNDDSKVLGDTPTESSPCSIERPACFMRENQVVTCESFNAPALDVAEGPPRPFDSLKVDLPIPSSNSQKKKKSMLSSQNFVDFLNLHQLFDEDYSQNYPVVDVSDGNKADFIENNVTQSDLLQPPPLPCFGSLLASNHKGSSNEKILQFTYASGKSSDDTSSFIDQHNLLGRQILENEHTDSNSLERLLMKWYYTGYFTGRYAAAKDIISRLGLF